MSLLDHIRELRRRVLWAFLALVAGTIVGFIFFDPLWEFLKQPYCQLSQAKQINNDECTLVVTGIFDAFFTQLKVALMVGAVLSSPVWLYQIWAFVTPGLRGSERKYTIVFLCAAVPLFFVGAALAYVTLDKGLALFLSFTPESVVPLIRINTYLGYALAMLLIFGATFEVPLLVVMLNLVGILSHERLARWRKGIIFGIFIFAAVATPSQDPVTMAALAVPTLVLFELAELIAYLNDRRRARRRKADPLANIADDEASPLDLDDEDSYRLESDSR